VGIPSEWQKVAIGSALLVGVTVPAIRLHRLQRISPGDGV